MDSGDEMELSPSSLVSPSSHPSSHPPLSAASPPPISVHDFSPELWSPSLLSSPSSLPHPSPLSLPPLHPTRPFAIQLPPSLYSSLSPSSSSNDSSSLIPGMTNVRN